MLLSVCETCATFRSLSAAVADCTAIWLHACMHTHCAHAHRRLKKHVLQCDEIILATDEDREGEAISWHILQLLKPTVIPTDVHKHQPL
jgi:DNA topoisomerase IA